MTSFGSAKMCKLDKKNEMFCNTKQNIEIIAQKTFLRKKQYGKISTVVCRIAFIFDSNFGFP